METCTMPRVLSVMPTALTEGSPPLEARTVYAMALAISDRKSTRLNSSHVRISYAVFCLKKKKKRQHQRQVRISNHTFSLKTQCISAHYIIESISRSSID